MVEYVGIQKRRQKNRAPKKEDIGNMEVKNRSPMDSGISNFKNSMIRKAIMETKNMVVVYIIRVSRLMENNT